MFITELIQKLLTHCISDKTKKQNIKTLYFIFPRIFFRPLTTYPLLKITTASLHKVFNMLRFQRQYILKKFYKTIVFYIGYTVRKIHKNLIICPYTLSFRLKNFSSLRRQWRSKLSKRLCNRVLRYIGHSFAILSLCAMSKVYPASLNMSS